MIRDPLTLAALIAGGTALGFWLDYRVPILSKVGASLLVIILGALLSNFGIVARDSAVYHAVEGPVTSLAIIFLLLSVNLTDLREAGPRLLLLFLIAGAGTAVGALTGALIFGGALATETWKLAGTFTGTYTGGGLNFAAVGRGLGLEPSTFAAAAAADNVTTAIWLGVTLAAPAWLMGRRMAAAKLEPELESAAAPAGAPTTTGGASTSASAAFPDPGPGGHDDADSAAGGSPHPFWGATAVSLLDLTLLGALGTAILLASRTLASTAGLFPEILWLTTLTLVLAQLPRIRGLRGARHLGNLGLHFFFVVIGIRSVVGEILRVGPEIFYYTLWVVAIHGLVLFGLGRLMRGTFPMIAVASQAAVGGPSTAMAITVARDWPTLMLPGVAVGLLGYALGNYAGFGIAHLTRWILGG